MERFALAKGFQGDGGDRFRREDGSWIGRANGSYFPWEQRTSNGEVVRYYWPKEHCLESKPLELAAEIWDMAKSRPDLYALVLEDTRGLPVEVTGARLGELVEQGAITLYLASYRLVFKGNHDS